MPHSRGAKWVSYEADILGVLRAEGRPMTPPEVGRRCDRKAGTAAARLDMLMHRGLVRRSPNPRYSGGYVYEAVNQE